MVFARTQCNSCFSKWTRLCLTYHIVSNSDNVLTFNLDIRGTANSVQAPMALTAILACIPKNHTSPNVFHVVLVLSPYWPWLFYWNLTSLPLPNICRVSLHYRASLSYLHPFVEYASLPPKRSMLLAIQRSHRNYNHLLVLFSVLPTSQTSLLLFF